MSVLMITHDPARVAETRPRRDVRRRDRRRGPRRGNLREPVAPVHVLRSSSPSRARRKSASRRSRGTSPTSSICRRGVISAPRWATEEVRAARSRTSSTAPRMFNHRSKCIGRSRSTRTSNGDDAVAPGATGRSASPPRRDRRTPGSTTNRRTACSTARCRRPQRERRSTDRLHDQPRRNAGTPSANPLREVDGRASAVTLHQTDRRPGGVRRDRPHGTPMTDRRSESSGRTPDDLPRPALLARSATDGRPDDPRAAVDPRLARERPRAWRPRAEVTVSGIARDRVGVTVDDEIDAVVGSGGVATAHVDVTVADGEVDVDARTPRGRGDGRAH